ncbi:hypothetical protein BEL04_23100 [Mucilaginibacter sp. PPCGB 2223]|nr:hypothetical protein BEL04_23100 [Mucilaginibacter sp. PPCGB 2223]
MMMACNGRHDKTVLSADKSFDAFFQLFKTDSVFQKSRIIFPLKVFTAGDEGESDTKTVTETRMKFIGLFIDKSEKGIVIKKMLSGNKTNIRFQIQDTGFEEEFTFIKINSKWYLSSVTDNSD